MPSVVMLVRHAEKPLGDGPPHGVTIDGTADPESLTPRGWQRAGALVALFAADRSDGAGLRFPTPTRLFASQIGPQSLSARPRETLLPLSERIGLAVDSSLRKEEIDQLVKAIQGTGGVVLVAWEHHLIPAIATMLVSDRSQVPQIWPDDRYDMVWVLERTGVGPGLAFRQVPEMLLAGDRDLPIASTDGA